MIESTKISATVLRNFCEPGVQSTGAVSIRGASRALQLADSDFRNPMALFSSTVRSPRLEPKAMPTGTIMRLSGD